MPLVSDDVHRLTVHAAPRCPKTESPLQKWERTILISKIAATTRRERKKGIITYLSLFQTSMKSITRNRKAAGMSLAMPFWQSFIPYKRNMRTSATNTQSSYSHTNSATILFSQLGCGKPRINKSITTCQREQCCQKAMLSISSNSGLRNRQTSTAVNQLN